MWPKDTPRPDSNPFKFKFDMKKEHIRGFLNDLHKQQLDMIEAVVDLKAQDGFPEATEVIKHIMSLK